MPLKRWVFALTQYIMCGRFTLTQSGEAIASAFQLTDIPYLEPRYNIAPTQPVPVVLATGEHPERQFRLFHWGLIPSWADNPKVGARMINARSETVADKPSFRTALRRRRCLIIADGFYEWQRIGNKKQPFYFQLNQHQPFAFAGLWEHWEHSDGDTIDSCTILTTAANELLRSLHDRMPVILAPEDYDRWLDPSLQKPDLLQPLLCPYPTEAMQRAPVSPQVNSPTYDQPDCIQPISL